MSDLTYHHDRTRLEAYFDRTAFDAWAQLTSEAPVSRVRAAVRAGRERMRDTLISWLPEDMKGRRLLDAGCGTGALAIEAARRGAEVTAVDVSARLIEIARERTPLNLRSAIRFAARDMLDPRLGRFDHVVAMDSLIHYRSGDIVHALAALAERTQRSVLFTVTPRTAPLTLMLAAGKLFPRADRAPAVAPTSLAALRRRLAAEIPGVGVGRAERVSGGFYTSQAMELIRP